MAADPMASNYLLSGLVIAFVTWRVLCALRARLRIPVLLQEGAQIVDVRSPAEFAAGHALGSRNIPLGELKRGATWP